DHERRDLPRIARVRKDVVDERFDAANARAKRRADPRREVGSDLELRVLERLTGRRDGELREAVGSADLLAVHVDERIEVPDLARDRRLETRGVEPGDRSDPALPREETVPGLLHRRAEGGDEPDARHDDPAAFAALHASSLVSSAG